MTGRRSMSVEHMVRDIGATPAHKGTELPTERELAKQSSKSPPRCRREIEDDKLFIPPPPPPPAVLNIDSPSPVNNHECCTNCNHKEHMKIMCTSYLKKTCRKCDQPGHNIITCGRPPKKAGRPQNVKPLPENFSPTPHFSKYSTIRTGYRGHYQSVPTPHNFHTLTHDERCKLCKGYGHQTKNWYIIHRNSRSTLESFNQKNTLRANQVLQLDLDTEVEPDLSIAQWMVDNQVY